MWKRTTNRPWLPTILFVHLPNNTMRLWQLLFCLHCAILPIFLQRLPGFGWNLVLDTHKQRKQKNYLPDLTGLSLFKQFQAFATGLQVFKLTKMAGSNSSPCAGLKSSRPSLRVITTFSPTVTAGLTQSGQQGSPISAAPTSAFLLPSPPPSFTDSELNDVYGANLLSMYKLFISGAPEYLWHSESPVIMESGQQAISYTPEVGLAWTVGATASALIALNNSSPDAGSVSPTDSLMGMEIDEQDSSATEYVYGMGGMGCDFADLSPPNNDNYYFGLSSPSEPSSPMFVECAMEVDSPAPCHNQEAATQPQMATSSSNDDANVQAFIFGKNGMGLDFATLYDQMAEQNRSFLVNMAMDGAMGPPPSPQNQGSSTQPQPTGPTRPSVLSLASPRSQTQVSSSSMPPHPTPLPTGTWIQPHGLPANEPPADPNASYRSQRALANSGVSAVTNYPISTSPRMTTNEVHADLNADLNQKYGANFPHWPRTLKESGDAVGVHPKDQEVKTSYANFMPFSYDSTFQPRTAAARAEDSDDDVSPRTKKPSNK